MVKGGMGGKRVMDHLIFNQQINRSEGL
jgi:hypothetical protein